MTWDRRRAAAWAGALLATTCLTGVARAQTLPPVRSHVDANGVDVVAGVLRLPGERLTVGQPGQGGLTFERRYDTLAGPIENLDGKVVKDGSTYTVALGGKSEVFTIIGSVYTPQEARGSTLTFNAGIFTYMRHDGLTATFGTAASTPPTGVWTYYIDTLTTPDGETRTFTFTQIPPTGGGTPSFWRRQSLRNNFGYQLHFEYQSDAVDTGGLDLKKVTGLNNTQEMCATAVNVCSGLTGAWPTLAYSSGSNLTITDQSGRVTTLSGAQTIPSGIRYPGSGSNDLSFTYSGTLLQRKVATVATPAGTWTYGYVDSGSQRTTTITDPLSHQRIVVSDTARSIIVSDTDALSRTVSYNHDLNNRLQTVTYPEGDSVSYAYDSRGNVTQTTRSPKPSLGGTPIVTTATYQPSCTIATDLNCNKPITVTDGKSQQTSYVYDPSHGGVTLVTYPAAGGVHPQIFYSYTQLTPWSKDTPGGAVVARSPAWRLTGTSSCAVGGGCVGTATEVKTTIAYGASGVANNLLPTSVSLGAGDGSLTATNAFTYNTLGDVLTVDGPIAGAADTTRYRYDAARQLVGIVGADPDGGSPKPNRAVRMTYTPRGQVSAIDRGTVPGQTDGAWSSFTTVDTQTALYDARGRRVKETLVGGGGGGVQSVTQHQYDAADRLLCSTVRMNPANYGSLWDACFIMGSGSFGNDRITRYTYDIADQLTQVTTADGTPEQRNALTATYTNNGQIQTAVDGNGNKTTYEYDGFDRLKKTRYPIAANGAVSSTTDYEELTYDANDNVTQVRRRDGALIGLTYDALDQLTFKDLPSGQPDTNFYYDNHGHVLQAWDAGQHFYFGYDALGRLTGQTGPLGSMAFQYDLAGRRTRLTWPDSLYVDYAYNPAGDMTTLTQQGGTTLLTYAYDNAGRRSGVTRANGASTTYGYDSVSRLASINHNLTGSAQDVTLTFGHNPAGQIISRATSNDAYAFPAANRDFPWGVNGLNQLDPVFVHDGRGNLTFDGGSTYAYDAENRLTGKTGGTSFSLSYDPLGRLSQTAGATTARFAWTGDEMVGEYDAGGLLVRRFVPGAGVDEPVVSYEGASTTDRRWLLSDQLGSVIAHTGAAGSASVINSYDEYGLRGPANAGRFQFTGQMLLPELGFYHYKARVFAPVVGRFLQTDPIGYAAGMNLYAYVDGDPANTTDSTGLFPCPNEERNDCTPEINPSPYRPTARFGTSYQVRRLLSRFGAGFGREFGFGNRSKTENSLPRLPDKPAETACPAGTYTQVSAGIGASAGVLVVGGVSVQVGATLAPELFYGSQLYGQVTFTKTNGLGFFAGGGPQGGLGFSDKPLNSGWSDSKYGEAAFGIGRISGSAGLQYGKDGASLSGGGGRAGPGGGLYSGVGKSTSLTIATNPTCVQRED